MARRTRHALLGLLLGLIGACDGDVQRPPSPATITVQLRLQTAAAPASFDALHLRLRDPASGAVLVDTLVAVDGSQSEWAIRLSSVMPRRTPVADVVVEAELLSGSVRVEYSGRTDAEIAAGTETVATLDLHRGPLDNLSVTSLGIRADTSAAMEDGSLQLHADLSDPRAGSRVYWHSLQADIATVDSAGLVSALMPGTASIVAVAGRAADTLDIHVHPRPASMLIRPDGLMLEYIGGTDYFSVHVLDRRGAVIMTSLVNFDPMHGVSVRCTGTPVCPLPIEWSSDDTTVAYPYVPARGGFRAVGNGRTTLHASWPAYGLSASAPYVVHQVTTRIDVDNDRLRFLYALGATWVVVARVVDANNYLIGPQPAVTWESSDENILTVHANPLTPNNGIAVATGNGTAGVRARLGEMVSGWQTIRVMQVVMGVEVTPAEAELAIGDSVRITAVARDGRGHPMPHASIGWTSSDESVATVAEDGTATAHRAGTAVITARGWAVGVPLTDAVGRATVHVH